MSDDLQRSNFFNKVFTKSKFSTSFPSFNNISVKAIAVFASLDLRSERLIYDLMKFYINYIILYPNLIADTELNPSWLLWLVQFDSLMFSYGLPKLQNILPEIFPHHSQHNHICY